MQADGNSDLVDFEVHLGRRPQHDPGNSVKVDIRKVSFWYGEKKALDEVSLKIHTREVTAFIGPSGCGKTTLLRCLNRTNDPEIVPGARMEGSILVDGENIHAANIDPPLIRRRFGWVAQRPNPFPWSVYANVAYGPRIHGLTESRAETDEIVEASLRRVGLWDEVKDRLKEAGTSLSGGQQQRLCIARAIATRPEIILMDEPASALDPIATALVEELVEQLREKYTIVVITHNMQEAARIAQRVAVFHLGQLVESGDATDIFLNPQHTVTYRYVTGRFG